MTFEGAECLSGPAGTRTLGPPGDNHRWRHHRAHWYQRQDQLAARRATARPRSGPLFDAHVGRSGLVRRLHAVAAAAVHMHSRRLGRFGRPPQSGLLPPLVRQPATKGPNCTALLHDRALFPRVQRGGQLGTGLSAAEVGCQRLDPLTSMTSRVSRRPKAKTRWPTRRTRTPHERSRVGARGGRGTFHPSVRARLLAGQLPHGCSHSFDGPTCCAHPLPDLGIVVAPTGPQECQRSHPTERELKP